MLLKLLYLQNLNSVLNLLYHWLPLFFNRSNSLFTLWNSYQSKLPTQYFTFQLLRIADLLYKEGLYQLARTHGYRRCLVNAGLLATGDANSKSLSVFASSCGSEPMALAMVSGVWGEGASILVI